MRNLRKQIYRLQSAQSTTARALLSASLFLYRHLDALLLHRSCRKDLGSEKLLILEPKVLYVGIPKVATRSLLDALQSYCTNESLKFKIAEYDIARLIDRFDLAEGWFKFTFVRNPWSRAASCYMDKIAVTDEIKWARHMHGRKGLQAGMPFSEFAKWLNSDEGSDAVADRHWISQYQLLGINEKTPLKYDLIGRFENLREDYARLIIDTGLSLPPLTHRLKTQAPSDYKRLYDDRSIQLIADRYSRDIELFGYSFDGRNS